MSNTPDPSGEAPEPPLRRVLAALAARNAEYHTDSGPDGDGDFVAVPVGFRKALHITLMDGTPPDALPLPWFWIAACTWDETNASDVSELAITCEDMVPRLVDALIAKDVADEQAMEDAMTPEDEKPFSQARRQAALNVIGTGHRMASEVAPRSTDPKHEPYWDGYQAGAMAAYCALTGEEDAAVVEQLDEAAQSEAQVRHDQSAPDRV